MASAAWRSARPRTLRPPRGSAAEAMIRRHGMKVSFDINLSRDRGCFSGRDLRRASSHRFDLRSAAGAGHENRLRGTRKTGTSVRPLLDNGFGICAEIDEQTKLAAGKSKIVHELRAVFFCQSFNGLDLDYDLPVTVEVGNICFLNRHALVKDAKLLLCVERYASCRQLPFKALLVNLFPKPVPKFTIDFIDCTAN